MMLVASVSLLACGGDDDATPGTTTNDNQPATGRASANTAPTDVCDLVTWDEVSTALGARATDRAATVPPVKQEVSAGLTADISACEYSAASTGAFVRLDLWEAKGQAAKVKEVTQFICSGSEEIPGLGDVACWYSEGHREIRFAKGGGYVDVKSGTAADDALLSLAEKAVVRLP